MQRLVGKYVLIFYLIFLKCLFFVGKLDFSSLKIRVDFIFKGLFQNFVDHFRKATCTVDSLICTACKCLSFFKICSSRTIVILLPITKNKPFLSFILLVVTKLIQFSNYEMMVLTIF